MTAHWFRRGIGAGRPLPGRARDWVARYVEELDPDLEPVGVERWVSVPTRRIVAEGRVDRIDERDGELVVVAYKTGKQELSCGQRSWPPR